MLCLCNFGTPDATSAGIESEINDLKNRKFHNVIFPLRGDKIVAFHLKALKIHLAEIAVNNIEMTKTGEYKAVNKIKKNRRDQEIQEHEELNAEHNWRNKNKKTKPNPATEEVTLQPEAMI